MMRLGRSWRPCIVALILASSDVPLCAQETSTAPNAGTRIGYTRIELPKDDADQWHRFKFGYEFESAPRPIDKFHKLLADANARGGGAADSVKAPRVVVAEYSARLEVDTLVGSARLDVDYDSDVEGFLALEGCGLAIENARWDDESELLLGAASDGQLGARVERPGVLRFDWSLRATQEPSGVLRFTIALPKSVNSKLLLEIPEELQLAASRGILESQEPIAESRTRVAVALGGKNSTDIVLTPKALSDAPSGPVVVQQQSRYEIHNTGLTLRARLRLRALQTAFMQPVIDVDVDAGLEIVSVGLNGRSLSWQPREEGGGILVPLGQPLPPHSDNLLELTAVGGIDLGNARRLPALRYGQALWLSDAVTIVVDHGLSIAKLDVEGGEVAQLGGSPGRDAGTSIELHMHRWDGRATLTLKGMPPVAECDREFAWIIAEDRVAGRLRATLKSTRGEIYETTFVVPAHWSFSEQDITVYRDGNDDALPELVGHRLHPPAVTGGNGPQEVRLALARPIAPGESMRIEILAMHERPLPNASARLDQLCFAQWPKGESGRTVAAIATIAPLTASVSAATDLIPLVAEDLDDSTRDWLGGVAPSFVVASNWDMSQSRLRVSRGGPRIQARIEQHAAVSAGALIEDYEVQCVPDGSGFDRVRLMFWPPRNSTPQWVFPKDLAEAGVDVERIDANGETSPDSPEIWEFKFPTSRSEAFRVSVQRATPTIDVDEVSVSFLSIAGAVEQHGRVVVSGERDTPISLRTDNVEPIAPSESELRVDADQVVWGAYQYEPTQTTTPTDARITLIRENGEARVTDNGRAFVWDLQLASTYAPGTSSSHRATWLVNNDSRDAIRITLPPASDVRSVAVNGVQQGEQQREGNELTIPLGDSGRLALVDVEFTMPQSSWGLWNKLVAPTPVVDIPVLQRRWLLSGPAGYTLPPEGARRPGIFAKLLGGLRDEVAAYDLPTPASQRDLGSAASLVDDLERRLLMPEATWGQALLGTQLHSDRQGDAGPQLLLIDAEALSSVGIAPERTVAARPSPATTLADTLAASHTVLILVEDRALLTSEQFIRSHRDLLRATQTPGVWRTSSATLASLFADEQTLAVHYVTPQVWASSLATFTSTRDNVLHEDTRRDLTAGNWAELALNENGTVVTVCHRASMRALALVLLIACAALALSVTKFPLRGWVVVVCLLACATVVLEAPWHLLPWGAAAGVVLGGAFAMTRRRRRAGHRNSTAASRVAAALPLVVAFCVGISSIAGADKSDKIVFPVWFPVDDEGNSTGAVHLPKPLAEALTAMAKANAQPKRKWLIDRAAYKLNFQWDTVDELLESGDLEMQYDVVVLDDVAQIELPLARGELALPEGWATLNDEPVDLIWRLGETSLQVPVTGRGRHQLQLRVRPSIVTQGGAASIAVAVPEVIQARLVFSSPASSPAIDVPNCQGRIQTTQPDDSERTIVAASLGAVDELRVRWTRRQIAPASDAVFDIDELLRFDFARGQPTLQAEFQGKLLRGEMTHLQIEVDRRLKLLPSEAQRVTSLASDNKAIALYRLPLSTSQDGFTAGVAFELPTALAAGHYALPLIRPLQAKRRRQWVALDAPDRTKLSGGVGLSKGKIEDFTRRWPRETPAPEEVYVCDLRQDARLISVAPLADTISVSESMSCLFSRQSIDCEYQANIDPGESRRQVLSFDIPPGVTVESVATHRHLVNEAGNALAETLPDVNVAWWGVDQQQLQVFLQSAPKVAYALEITASTRAAPPRRGKLPAIRIRNAKLVSSRVEIRRRPDVLVEIVRQLGFAAIADATDAGPSASRSVTALEALLDQPQAKTRSCTVGVRPNHLAASGTQITQLINSRSLWRLRVDISLDVRDGRIDTLQFEVPAHIAESVRIEPQQQLLVRPTLSSNTRRLVVIPNQNIDGHYQASLIATDVIGAGDEVRVPDVKLLSDIPLTRYVAVPSSFESRDIAWETDGLQRVGEAAFDAEWAAHLANSQLFQVVADPHQATLRSLTEVVGVPLVRLADVHFTWQSAGNAYGRALIDLEPAGLSECVVELPEAMRMCRLRVDDLPAQARALSHNRWRVQLQSTRLPQRIEIQYAGSISPSGHSTTVQAVAPVLADIAIERTLWTLYAPADAGEPLLDTPNLTPGQQSVIRLREMADLIRLPRHLRLEYTSSQTHDWLSPWQRRWQRERRRLGRHQLVLAAISPESDQLPLHDVDQGFQQAVADLEVTAASAESPRVDASREDDAELGLLSGTRVAARRMVKGTSRNLSIRFEPPTAPSTLAKTGISLAFLFAGVLAWLSPRWLPHSDWPLRYGQGIVTAAVLITAFALWPSLWFWSVVIALIVCWVWLRRSSQADPLVGAIIVQGTPRETGAGAENF